MKKTIGFHSVLAEQMQLFVAFKRMHGYDYTSQARTLSYFDRFLVDEADGTQPLCLGLGTGQRYARTTAHLKGFLRQSRLSSLR